VAKAPPLAARLEEVPVTSVTYSKIETRMDRSKSVVRVIGGVTYTVHVSRLFDGSFWHVRNPLPQSIRLQCTSRHHNKKTYRCIFMIYFLGTVRTDSPPKSKKTRERDPRQRVQEPKSLHGKPCTRSKRCLIRVRVKDRRGEAEVSQLNLE